MASSCKEIKHTQEQTLKVNMWLVQAADQTAIREVPSQVPALCFQNLASALTTGGTQCCALCAGMLLVSV